MSLNPNDDIFSTNKTPKTLESEKQRLRDKQEDEYEDPDNIYVKIKIPTSGKIGEDCVVKFSKKVPMAQLVISQDIQMKRKYVSLGKKGEPELTCKGFIIVEAKDCKEIRATWEDIGYLHSVRTNLLLAGEYVVEARGYSNEAYEETTSRRLISVK